MHLYAIGETVFFWATGDRRHLIARPAATPGLSKEPHMTCPLCNIANLVTIAMTVNQRQLTLHSCSRCETRWWKADGDQVGLTDVLHAARKTA